MSFGKKLFVVLAGAAVAALCLAPVAMAAVQGSNHDMTVARFAASQKAGACSYCHIPHKAAGAKLWPSAPVTGMALNWANEPISLLCWSCHLNGSTYTTAQQVNPFQNASHQRTVGTLTGWGDIASLPTDVPVSSTTTSLKCTSCHNVHDNSNRPFIRFVTTGVGTYQFDLHCIKCHPNRVNAGQTTLNTVATGVGNVSQHPTGKVYSDTGIGGTGFNPLVAINAVFTQNPGAAANPSEAGYNLGGHLSLGTTGNMTCATCHLVHGNETLTYSQADGASVVATPITQFNVLVFANPAPATTSGTCQSCHSFSAQAGPGLSTMYSHPINTVSTAWSVAVNTLATAPQSQWGSSGGNAVIVCQSCHNMHYGLPASSILTGSLDAPAASSNSNCDWCHSGTQSMAGHHPTGPVTPGTDYVTGARTHLLTEPIAWSTRTPAVGTGPAYQFPGGNMTCGTCHAARAHNNVGSFPGLVGLNAGSEMCVDCHSFNPSTYTSVVKVNNASSPQSSTVTEPATHFVGTIATANYRRTANWSSGAPSKWGNANTTIICESCHTLRTSQSGVTPRSSNNSLSSNGTNLRTAVGLLVEVSGNDLSTYDGTASATWPKTGTVDMCTGCHGASGVSAAGSTHPVISNMTVNATAAVIAKIDRFLGTVSHTNNTRVNCESCHRPHDAAAGSGALILESCDTNSTKTVWQRVVDAGYTNEAVFCNQCHNY
jgi:hypothetical protein